MRTVVVVGNGMVGLRVLQELKRCGDTSLQLVTFCEEPRPAYDRVHLSAFFSGKTAEDLSLASLEWYAENGIELFLNDAVIAIDRERHHVRSKRGEVVTYDQLVLATGSAPFVPSVPGVDKKGIFVYRTLEDLEKIKSYAEGRSRGAVIGGGLLGLEAAKALVDLGVETTVVEFAPRLMPRQIDGRGSGLLQKKIAELGVSVMLGANTQSFEGNDAVESMIFKDGTQLPVDMVVVSAGIRPRDELAKACGLEVGARGGIVVDESLRTSDRDIFAVGECALSGGMIYGLVGPGYRMAEVVAKNIVGGNASFKGADMSTKLKLMGVDVASIGDSTREDKGVHAVEIFDGRAGSYKKIVVDSATGTMVGAIFVGDASEYAKLLPLYLDKVKLPEKPESLLVEVPASGGVAAGIGALPDSAQICSCENISKGSILEAVRGGCGDVGAIKKCTRAGTGCGSCVPLLSDLLNAELEKSGAVVDRSLCEHFAYTRQELYEIVKMTGARQFSEVLVSHGRGRGCEICKPALASIFASAWNEYVLDQQNIQDTNDRYLANMQKNGTYSVVPRVPGGEITPEQLIAIGEVARQFNLYTKITGGQRIDLFGARVEDLPVIWQRLGKVGMESGHAYAKAVRTVKSCVGSTWCRFGVQDSVQMAIDIENRYKGLRAPHKLKFAVSGCARECAEAQSKDVGIIATEKGWNLYVCGNGGMKPRHADLLLTDIDGKMLIRTIDRFLMYYIKTADRLTRTATWLDKLPGGIGHVRDVVVHDSLGIGEELEQQMKHIVDTYVCEWKRTLQSPELLSRFKPFVNSNEPDTSIKFVRKRGQYQPV